MAAYGSALALNLTQIDNAVKISRLPDVHPRRTSPRVVKRGAKALCDLIGETAQVVQCGRVLLSSVSGTLPAAFWTEPAAFCTAPLACRLRSPITLPAVSFT